MPRGKPLKPNFQQIKEDIEPASEDLRLEEPEEPLPLGEPIPTEEYGAPPQQDISTVKVLTRVDAPVDIKQVFWSFVSKDIAISNITDKDFNYILTNLRLRLYSFIQKFPIEEWDNITFVEYDYTIVPVLDENGMPLKDEEGNIIYTREKYIKRSWDFTELLLDLEEFVYNQLTRGRAGFTFRRLTESFQVSEIRRESQGQQSAKKEGWRL